MEITDRTRRGISNIKSSNSLVFGFFTPSKIKSLTSNIVINAAIINKINDNLNNSYMVGVEKTN